MHVCLKATSILFLKAPTPPEMCALAVLSLCYCIVVEVRHQSKVDQWFRGPKPNQAIGQN